MPNSSTLIVLYVSEIKNYIITPRGLIRFRTECYTSTRRRFSRTARRCIIVFSCSRYYYYYYYYCIKIPSWEVVSTVEEYKDTRGLIRFFIPGVTATAAESLCSCERGAVLICTFTYTFTYSYNDFGLEQKTK